MDEKQNGSLEAVFDQLFDGIKKGAKEFMSGLEQAKDEFSKIDLKDEIFEAFETVTDSSKDIFETLKDSFEDLFKMPDFSKRLMDRIRIVKDFPRAGVDFFDITPLLMSPVYFDMACLSMIKNVDMSNIDTIVAIEARGFLFATKIASMYNKGLILVRKQGKLPPPLISKSYKTEYSSDVLEMKPGTGNVLIVDDVLATGGTLRATETLCNEAGYQVKGISVLLDVVGLHPKDFLSAPLHSGIKIEKKEG